MLMDNEHLQSVYKCSDFALVVTLSLWLPIEGIDRTDPRRAYFLFQQTQALLDLVSAYHHREVRVDPLAFYQASKNIKARLYESY